MRKPVLFVIAVVVLIMGLTYQSSISPKSNADVQDTKLRNAVESYYNKFQPNNSGEISFLAKKPLGNEYLVLAKKYSGEGHVPLDLFIIDEKFVVTHIAGGQTPVSMCFSINRIKLDDQVVLFGSFNNSKWLLELDKRKRVQIDKISVEYTDGTTHQEAVSMDKGYIIIADSKTELKSFDLYDKHNRLQSNLEDLRTYGNVFHETEFRNVNEPIAVKKPVIYLYPTSEQSVSVKLDFQGQLEVTYPEYNNGWQVVARPDGTLINKNDQREYSYLFWEGISYQNHWDLSKGHVVKGEDTKAFLEETLTKMGLNPRERNDFIVYWLPEMIDNKYNLIHFAQEEYEKLAPLEIYPKPDSILRVFMVFKPLDHQIEIDNQPLHSFERNGFSVIEWGGTEID